MNLNFYSARQSRADRSPRRATRFSGARLRKYPPETGLRASSSQRGIALIITLIMLSIITFMTVTFLVLSQRERGSVTTSTDQLIAKNTADSALERAKIELLAPMLAQTNDQLYGLLVSTNYINSAGFSGAAIPEPYRYTNVNFNTYLNGSPINNLNDQRQNLLNLLYNPRPPVFLTNRATARTEFRYYLDLNRNGVYDTNGWSGDTDRNGRLTGETNFNIGDPEWIGVLERPELPHSSSNKFVARYAYIAIPAGKTLDVNYLHNQAVTRDLNGANDGFLRNQGVGTYEINLAAFLADLNTNIWNPNTGPYKYRQPAFANTGLAFEDAQSLLRYRYAGQYANLQSVDQIFANGAQFQNDSIDQYADGNMMLGSRLDETPAQDQVTRPWAGADNPNHYFTDQDFFDGNKTSGGITGFTNRLIAASTNLDSYDRNTFYRMIAQLGTDSSPEREKININYRNVTNGVIVPGLETNQFRWRPIEFFTNAANRILRTHTAEWLKSDFVNYTNTFGTTTNFGITNIPVFIAAEIVNPTNSALLTPTNYYGYTPSVHRLLQVVANIYDSTTNDFSAGYPYDPHVFRPIFRRDASNNVFIVDYLEVDTVSARFVQLLTTTNQIDLSLRTGPFSRASLPLIGSPIRALDAEPMVSGIPLVIGAKKGFPSFSQFGSQNSVNVSRTLRFLKNASQTQPSSTNQIYSFGISNAFGMQAFNPYSTTFPRPLVVYASADVTLFVTNEFGAIAAPAGMGLTTLSNRFAVELPPKLIPRWPGYQAQNVASFITPFISNYVFMASNVRYVQTAPAGGGVMVASGQPVWDTPNTFHVPKLWLGFRARARFVLVDSVSPGRIVDYVNLDSEEAPIDIMQTVLGENPVCGGTMPSGDTDPGSLWCTNRVGNPTGAAMADNYFLPTYGIQNQMDIAAGIEPVSEAFWKTYNKTVNDKSLSTEAFRSALFDRATRPMDFEAPFNPSRTFYQYADWSVNDPLVHYTVADLTDLLAHPKKVEYEVGKNVAPNSPIVRMLSRNPLPDHYRPWGGNPNNPVETSVPTMVNTQVKDPQIMTTAVASDLWDFPTNRLPNVGWLGRIHRGTPWQTIYMKSSDVPISTWFRWTGNTWGNGADAFMERPVKDRELFDVFTTALNENSTRGQLPINQTNLAAWSAVLSGVPVITNNLADRSTNSAIIQPAALSPEVSQIVAGINLARAQTNRNGSFVFPNGQFSHLGDVLATPQLTEASPFLNTNGLVGADAKLSGGINDEIMERIPQQIMSLLSLDHAPRFVIYAYGQTLRPAPNSIVTASGPYFQMCTNYQVTAETATRSVLRVEGSLDPADSDNPDPLHHYPPRVIVEQYNILPPD